MVVRGDSRKSQIFWLSINSLAPTRRHMSRLGVSTKLFHRSSGHGCMLLLLTLGYILGNSFKDSLISQVHHYQSANKIPNII